MTPEANKAIVRRYIDELNHRNLAILDEGLLMNSVKLCGKAMPATRRPFPIIS